MSHRVRELYASLQADGFRRHTPFTPALQGVHDKILHADSTNEQVANELQTWLASTEQPCLFGRAAARRGMLHFCILRETDLQTDDLALRDTIQVARREWRARARHGHSSAFVIAAVSDRLAFAAPDQTLKSLAKRLCSLYLLRDVAEDQVYHDEILLEKPGGKTPVVWKWLVGVNFFGAQADGRWWQDHRIPGGIAFSMNSVGHMVRSARLAGLMKDVDQELGLKDEGDWIASNLNSLDAALLFAMKTIAGAKVTSSGPATWLLPNEAHPPSLSCPVQLTGALVGKNHCEYGGNYHTDFTIPSHYFRPDVQKPADAGPYQLDFTYLFDKSIDNFDYMLMGEGERIMLADRSASDERRVKRLRAQGWQVSIEDDES